MKMMLMCHSGASQACPEYFDIDAIRVLICTEPLRLLNGLALHGSLAYLR